MAQTTAILYTILITITVFGGVGVITALIAMSKSSYHKEGKHWRSPRVVHVCPSHLRKTGFPWVNASPQPITLEWLCSASTIPCPRGGHETAHRIRHPSKYRQRIER